MCIRDSGNIVSSMHVHLDEHMCLEVIVLRGHTELVQSLSLIHIFNWV